MEGILLFRILTPAKEVCSVQSDSVILCEKDNGKNQGGSLGIRPGHLPAVVALEENGPVRAFRQGNVVFAAHVRGGFARVDAASVTILTPEATVLIE